MDIVLEVLKWIIVILIAGFIGQFGKSISLHIMGYLKKRKEKHTATEPEVTKEPQVASTESPEAIVKKEEKEKQQLKVEKKAIKAQLKARKKAEKVK